MTHPTVKRGLGRVVTGLGLAMVLVAAFASPAHADDRERGRGPDREWRAHEVHARRWHQVHPVYEPGYVYAPPPVVYAPQPSPGINLIIPMHFN